MPTLIKAAFGWTWTALTSAKFWVGVPVGAILLLLAMAVARRRRYRAVQVHLNLPFGLGNVTYEAADQDRKLAWTMYVELKTRKAALPFDEDSDVLVEVYDSLQELFSVTRELLIQAELTEVQRPEGIPDLLLRVLNDGLRPHLTKWQAVFRRWWDQALADDANDHKCPQEIQRQFPNYQQLIAELKIMNTELSKYAEDLIVIARTPSGSHGIAVTPALALEAPRTTAPESASAKSGSRTSHAARSGN